MQRWSGNRLKAVVMAATSVGRDFWSSADCAELVDQVDQYLSGQISRSVRAKLGYAIERDEVTNTVLVRLAEASTGQALASGMLSSRDPWAYLAKCAGKWAIGQAGHRVGELDALVHLPGVATSAADAGIDPAHGLTPLPIVIEKTATTVEAFVDDAAERSYRAAVRWFAENPPTHQGHGHAGARRAPEFARMGFAPDEVAALARVTWGGRPNMHVTSLFRAFLLDDAFDPHASRPHRLALMNMRAALARAGVQVDQGRAA